MRRREFLRALAPVLASPLAPALLAAQASGPRVQTVRGELPAEKLGTMLPHEHVLVDFIGAAKASPDRYDADEVFGVMLPYLKRVKEVGCQTLVECTPAYLGRDPVLLRRLSKASGVHLITNTGYYGARQGKFLPAHVQSESARQLAGRWTKEWKDGIGETGIRPGFIKIGVDSGQLTEINRKIVEAAAICHLKTGLTIAGHTGDGVAATEQVEILKKNGVSPEAWIWVHAQSEKDLDHHRRLASAGAWIELDGIRPSSVRRHVEMVLALRRAKLLGRVLLSHDAGWYSVGEPGGGQVRGYRTLFEEFLPALRKEGVSEEEIRQLTVSNPARAFSIGVRRR